MSQKSSIEWTSKTWNPTRGCSKVSAGCVFCYAATFAHRFEGVTGNAYELGFTPRIVPERLIDPLLNVSPDTYFVNSMSDLFHESFSDDYIEDVFKVMQCARQHKFQLLTKRSERMRDFLNAHQEYAQLKNVIWGVSVENVRHGLPRVEHLRQTNARFKFLSIEPLLEDLGQLDLSGINWVIVGGESGHGARTMEEEWVLSIKKQCNKQKVKFFFKQWGGVRKSEAGRLLRGREYNALPKMPRLAPSPQEEQIALVEYLEKKYGNFRAIPRRLRRTPR